jgi:membrane-associated phospholipid phosphatase
MIVPVLKKAAGRSRPNTGQGATDFNPFNGGESFPSGHTAEAFTIAASIAENYDAAWVKGLSYGVAGLVGYARMEHDAHWLSDVTASAFIGIGVVKQVSRLNRGRRGSELAFAPFDEHGVRGIRVAVAF